MKGNKEAPQYGGIHYTKSKPTFSYQLGDGEKSNQEHPETFSIPSRKERENLIPGMNVKLIFQIRDGDMELTERMWVIVTDKKPDHYVGSLNNNPCSTTKLRAGDEVIFRPEHVINIIYDLIEDSAGDLPGKTQDNDYLAIGADLEHLSSVEQAEICHYLADQVDHFAQSQCEGYLGSVDISRGFLQLTVHCENTEQALTDFLSMLVSGEIDIPEDNDEAPVFQYAMIGEGDPVMFMFDMIDQVNGEEFVCDDCIKKMKEEEAAQAKKTGKQEAETSATGGCMH